MNARIGVNAPWYRQRRVRRGARAQLVTASWLACVLAFASPAVADPGHWVDPEAEARNVLIMAETTGDTAGKLGTSYPGDLAAATLDYQSQRLAAVRADPERQPTPNSCTLVLTCPINPEHSITRWQAQGGLVEPVLFTSRSGATLSGHVWATREGPERRPGVVFSNGSIASYEQVHWSLAQALARAGYVVLTYDPQGEGMSDQFGAAPDQLEDAFAGVPILGFVGPQSVTGAALNGTHRPVGDGLGVGGNGLPFYDGQIDALDFFLSTPDQIYAPRPSRTTGTSHNAKQQRRVAAGLDSAHNPLWQLLDPDRIGLAGHSYGAQAASWNGQADPRVSAIVALDSLCVPGPPLDEEVAFTTAPVNNFLGAQLPSIYGFPQQCFGSPNEPPPALSKPALHMTGDYLLLPEAPYLQQPVPENKSGASLAYSAAGVDTAAVILRGGNHFDYVDSTGVLPTSLRGLDLVTWYTTVWFDKYLQHDPTADTRLIDTPWRNDPATGTVDPSHDPNVYSYHYLSRLDITRGDGTRYRCEDLRDGCR
ncbi:alpha/beta hydrolase family protein [Nocardia sp. N2S4-5]|uniref:alpha/beta hydrolase family protein n=1 Tax=Nocardia sp. N2S4-5 TaxID=3351565 RepID=UPI0037CD2605